MKALAEDLKQPFAILVAALGGEGGGVLADWLVKCGLRAGLVVQATSVPGVAQRTGATSYYLELMRIPLPADSPRPILSLNPLPGRIDVLVASEAVEAARMMERGFVSPDRTVLIASTHRVYTTAEKMHMSDGRYDTVRTRDAARRLSRRAVLLDMEATATRHGTVLSAVMFGALSGAGVLPWSRELCEEVIRASGRNAASSLAGFDDAYRQASATADVAGAASAVQSPAAHVQGPATHVQGPAGEGDAARAASAAGASAAVGVLRAENLPQPLLHEWSQRLSALPLPVQTTAAHGALRCRDYQDDAYAAAYLEAVAGLASAGAVPPGPGAVAVAADGAQAAEAADRRGDAARTVALDEAARHLALWMCYEDVIRVADLKTRKGRRERVRAEARAQATDVVRVVEYLKPGVEEIAAILPRRAGSWLMRSSAGHGWLKRAQVGVHVRSSALWGHLLLRAMARLRPFRRSSLRFHEEQEAIAAWTRAMEQALPISPSFARQLAELPQVLKGYGDTQLRGRHNYARLWAAHVAPAFGEGGDPDAEARRLKEALAQTLADPEGRLNAAAATAGDASVDIAGGSAPDASPIPQTIRWIERPRGGALRH
jgi:indolepyruvate ferredoxin oxidoreductase, beta subunit